MQHIRKRLASIFPISVAGKSIRYAYKQGRKAIVSEIRGLVNPRHGRAKPTITCSICLDDDINANEIFCVDTCCHRFCSECVKRHIEVRLLEGSVIRCPHYRCKCQLTFGSCANLLTPQIRKMWQQRINEDSIPVTKRIYCPNPRCSALMFVNNLSDDFGVMRYCFECRQLFCINCKVPWHNKLSCDDYKRLGPNPTAGDIMFKALANDKSWRQCGNCKNMIELSGGCIKVSCRCGHMFCYKCGAEAGGCHHGTWHVYPPKPE